MNIYFFILDVSTVPSPGGGPEDIYNTYYFFLKKREEN
jgi:hypothetical protein